MYGYHPRMSFENEPDKRFKLQSAKNYAIHLEKVMTAMKKELTQSQSDQKKYYNWHLKDITFKVGDKVWLNRRNIRTKRPSWKLDWKIIGPFRVIEKYEKNAYKLDLPPSYQIHDVFHVNLLEKDPTDVEPPLDITAEKKHRKRWIVESVWDSKVFKPREISLEDKPGDLYYLVHWNNKPNSKDTWEPATQIRHLKKVVRKFHAANPAKPRSIWAAPTRNQKKK